MQLILEIFGESGQHAVKYVVVPLVGVLMNDPRLFQKILLHLGSLNHARLVEVNVDVLSKSRRIIIADSFGISKGWNMKGFVKYIFVLIFKDKCIFHCCSTF